MFSALDCQSRTPMDIALECCDEDMAKLLLQKGAGSFLHIFLTKELLTHLGQLGKISFFMLSIAGKSTYSMRRCLPSQL
jgi:ankyrin repeat protein